MIAILAATSLSTFAEIVDLPCEYENKIEETTITDLGFSLRK